MGSLVTYVTYLVVYKKRIGNGRYPWSEYEWWACYLSGVSNECNSEALEVTLNLNLRVRHAECKNAATRRLRSDPLSSSRGFCGDRQRTTWNFGHAL